MGQWNTYIFKTSSGKIVSVNAESQSQARRRLINDGHSPTRVINQKKSLSK